MSDHDKKMKAVESVYTRMADQSITRKRLDATQEMRRQKVRAQYATQQEFEQAERQQLKRKAREQRKANLWVFVWIFGLALGFVVFYHILGKGSLY